MDDPNLTPPTAAAAERPLQPTAEPPISAGKGVKETVESILIAFILAFVFRAFVVEAFVIPTGSMAPTLLGAHMRFTCKECGYTFDTNYQTNAGNSEDIDIPSRAGPVIEEYKDPDTGEMHKRSVDRKFDVVCPNCRYGFTATNPFVRYGDRILVLKYVYIPWVSPQGPNRWDVVVFKNPTDKPTYAMNYIKRLTGLPGEWIMILDGDVYVCNDPQYADVPRSQALREIPASAWRVQNKPGYAQEALWRLIYDHDYRPLDKERTDGWTLPWVHNDGDGWHTGAEAEATPAEKLSRVITFDNAAGGGKLRFRSSPVPGANPLRARGGYFTDWLAYDMTMLEPMRYTVFTVSDLKLAFTYQRKSGDGPLIARMTKYDHEFALRLDPDKVTLAHRWPDGHLSPPIAPLRAFDPSKEKGSIRVEFENADYQMRVRINDQLTFETNREEFYPNVTDLLSRHAARADAPVPTVAIDASRQEAALSHVSLWRDVYYTPASSQDPLQEIMHGRPGHPMKLGPDEYFVMGDNSAGSYDARYWAREVDLPEENLHAESGRVPGRFMLGRAFFVYWPAGYRPLNTAPALVPNFGDMRLIH